MFGWIPCHVKVCRRSSSSLSAWTVGHLCCRGRMGASRGLARRGSQGSYSIAKLSGSARSLVTVPSAMGVLLQATCSGWPGCTV